MRVLKQFLMVGLILSTTQSFLGFPSFPLGGLSVVSLAFADSADDIEARIRRYTRTSDRILKDIDKASEEDGVDYREEGRRQREETIEKHRQEIQAERKKQTWTNDAEPSKRWFVCCDNQQHFYAKVTDKVRSMNGQMSADGETWINARYCLTNPYPLSDGADPTYPECILALGVVRNLRDHHRGSMYAQ